MSRLFCVSDDRLSRNANTSELESYNSPCRRKRFWRRVSCRAIHWVTSLCTPFDYAFLFGPSGRFDGTPLYPGIVSSLDCSAPCLARAARAASTNLTRSSSGIYSSRSLILGLGVIPGLGVILGLGLFLSFGLLARFFDIDSCSLYISFYPVA